MMTITLIQKTPFTEFSSWYGREVTRVPVHWAGPDGKEHFLINRLTNPDGDEADAYVRMDAEEHVRMIDAFTRQLAENDGAWIAIHNACSLLPRERREAGPLDWVAFVREKGWTFDGEMTRILVWEDGVDFSGNITEYSAAFQYRIWSPEVLERLREAAPEVPVERHEPKR